jgi:hypothetical protein
MKRSRLPFAGPIALCAALAMAPLSPAAFAQNYTVTINPTLNGLDVKFSYQAEAGMLVVSMTNNADRKVRCDFQYNAPPQFPYNTSEFAQPGKTVTSIFRGSGAWFAVTVNVTCVAAAD